MSDSLERRMAAAFDGLHAPCSVQQRALAAIEAARSAEGAADALAAAEAASDAGCSAPAPSPTAPPRAVAQGAPPGAGAGATLVVPDERLSATSLRRPRPKRRSPWAKAALAAAACLVVAAVGLGGYQLYESPAAYVGIDVNPSVELSVNCFDVVVAARAVNDDGAAVLSEVQLVGQPYDQALGRLMASPALSPYLSNDAVVEISVTSDDERLSDQLVRASDSALAQHQCHGSASSADEATRQEAVAAGMGVARYRAAQELMALDPTVTLEGCAGLSMRQLRDCIASHHGGGSDDASAGDGSQGTPAASEGEGSQGAGQGSGPRDGTGYGAQSGQGAGPQDGTGHGAGHGGAHRGAHGHS